MQNPAAPNILDQALDTLAEMNPQGTGGVWLENLTVTVAPHLKEWDIAQAWPWAAWPERESRFPGTDKIDIGIDVIARRRSDGQTIAIQCKARQLDAAGHGNDIAKDEVDRFTAASVNALFAERWLVTNGDNRMSDNARQMADMSDPNRPIKLVNIHADILEQRQAAAAAEPELPGPPEADAAAPPRQTKSAMQAEAVAASVRILQEHAAATDADGNPAGQARGKIILPCGAGKTRVSLRIVEELTPAGGLAIVLCPSIALVAQIRREYLQHSAKNLRPLAVCSDKTAAGDDKGYNPKREERIDTVKDPTADNGNVSASEVKGKVTTDPAEIGRWIQEGAGQESISVIFGTYQSGHRIAAALIETGTTACVLIADEAHRTAGLRRSPKAAEQQRRRDFTLCHDSAAFPATYRVYQTATPRIYDTRKVDFDKPGDWIVRSMDDPDTFGVELYRKSYVEAVNNGWLADYRIIALGINDREAYAAANQLAQNTQSKGRRALTTHDYLRGLTFALAMGGATQHPEHGDIPIKSCIAFMNTVDKSKNMAADLASPTVRQWLQKWMDGNRGGQTAAAYTLEHLDATSNVAARDNAKQKLAAAAAPAAGPHGIINVGIFGEGTDSPTLNAVAFLESRKSPIDVIQAVGRAMRAAPGKELGYIICPIYIPPDKDPETHLSHSAMEEGWSELGQILLALRAHDSRIEDNLAALLQLYLPPPPAEEHTLVAIATPETQTIDYRLHDGPPGSAAAALDRVMDGASPRESEFRPLPTANPESAAADCIAEKPADYDPAAADAAAILPDEYPDPSQIITVKVNSDGSQERRIDTVLRDKPHPDGSPGSVDLSKSKAHAADMINKGKGQPLTARERAARPTRAERVDRAVQQALQLLDWEQHGNAITVNLLTKSGLAGNRVLRDLNVLEGSIAEAAHQLRSDELLPILNRHFGLDNLTPESRSKQADGCTIAALLLMNAAMLHQRIAAGAWLSGISNLAVVKSRAQIIPALLQQWTRIISHDFRPIIAPAVDVIYAVQETGKRAGLDRALRHIAAEAERIAATYADLGADHAGPLFNRVMGNQASDGAFFTRPPAAALAANLTLDCLNPHADWTDPAVWRDCKAVDLACGSGTLLAALLTAMKNRAAAAGAPPQTIAALQRVAVEDTLKGLDINPVSLQLAAAQLTAGNQEIRYRQMGLHLMPYGPQADNSGRVAAGTLELLGQQAIVPRRGAMDLGDDQIQSRAVWNQGEDAELEDAVAAVRDARIVIMNPPFSSREKMGEKFPPEIKQALRQRADEMKGVLVNNDKDLDFASNTSIAPLFVALADKCVRPADGILTMINPTIALSNPSGIAERRILAQRYHIHTVLSCHQPAQVNLSQHTGVNESIVVMRRPNAGPKPPTRFINLDRMPVDDGEVDEMHQCLAQCDGGSIPEGWGEVSWWPAERIESGDWTPAIWRSPELAEAAARFANDENLITLRQAGLSPEQTGRSLSGTYERTDSDTPGSFPVLDSKGADGQIRIQAIPDGYWIPKNRDESIRQANGGTYPEVDRILQKSGHLLITEGQNNSTGRLTATASDTPYFGYTWMPISVLTPPQAKALAVFLNSTPGRLQLMRNQGKTLVFPIYRPAGVSNIRIPDLHDARIGQILAECWERTREMPVPQFRAGECEVRQQWDAAVAEALGYDETHLTHLRHLLHREPHVRGLGYGQYGG